MADEGRLREEMNRGTEAAAILRNPIFIESFESLRTRYATVLADTPPNAPDVRECLPGCPLYPTHAAAPLLPLARP